GSTPRTTCGSWAARSSPSSPRAWSRTKNASGSRRRNAARTRSPGCGS
ncbi:hypothetical protein, partial [Nocardioides sp. Soil796]